MDLSSVGDTSSTYSRELGDSISGLASRSNADVARQYTSGNQEARGLLNDSGTRSFNQGLGFNDQAMGEAIRNKYAQQYKQKETKLNNEMFKSASEDHIRQLASASQMANEEVEMNRQKEILRWKMQQAKKAQRGAVLGHVLGIAGGIGAGIATQGTGAVGGYMAGEAAGNAIGGA